MNGADSGFILAAEDACSSVVIPAPLPLWVSVPNGTSLTYGHIPAITGLWEASRNCPAGEIRFPIGARSNGFLHLNEPGKRELFDTEEKIASFVHVVTSQYDEIYVQEGRNAGGVLLFRKDGYKAVIVSRTLRDGYYPVVTAFSFSARRPHKPIRRNEFLVWSR